MMMMHRLASQMSLILLMLLCAVRFNTITCCHESDRSLLLMFKQGVVDPSNRLSSWSTLQDCCQWEGIWCDGNNRVTALALDNQNQNVSESLRGEISLSSLLELEFLDTLHFDYNDFELTRMPSINNSVATLTHLLPNSSSMLTDLSLSDNIHLHIDNIHYWLSRLPSLQYLNLGGIHLPSDETNWVQSLASLPLRELYLYDCNLTTSSLEQANFSSSLSSLDLSLNDFRYGFPNWLFNLSEDLSHLALSQCNLRGQIPDFSGFRNLEFLDLSHNKLEGLIPDWLGQLDGLKGLDLSNNLFYSSIPSNLINASSSSLYLDISFNNLSGPLPKILGQNMSRYQISGNNISQVMFFPLPRLNIFMSFNKFEGELPQVSPSVQSLDLAHNFFSGHLSSLLCQTEITGGYVLEYLDLSNNYLTQELPDCWKNWPLLSYIYLGNNQLVGQVPSAMGSSLHGLRALDLHNNGFFGDIPWTFHDSRNLMLLNLEGNNFSGSIHTWIPQSVSIVKLRSNQFTGNIPLQLCGLSNLIVLDLANNKLSGSIPHCLHNITSFFSVFDINNLTFYSVYPLFGIPATLKFMKIGLHTKGQQLEYQKNLKLVRSIDLSANKLSGEIPIQLFKLTKLQSLNLSYNYLIGEIPEQIGEMKDLESLDLSHNLLHGNIPQSMSSLSFLSDLNMSYNHFNGQIPLGTQLQGFDAWSYTGNPELCGPPLQNNCTIPKNTDNTEHAKGNEDYDFLKSLYLGMGVGFATGFWLVCGSLFLKRAWRHAYFQFFNGVVDRIYVIVNIKLQRFR